MCKFPGWIWGGKAHPSVTLIDVRNNGGSVEHYYHFLLGYLLPLCAYVGQRDDASILLVRACGPLSHLVCEVGIPGLLLCERQSHADFSIKAGDLGLKSVQLSGLDLGRKGPPQYDADRVALVANQAMQYMGRRLGRKIESIRKKLESDWKASPRLVVIKREDPDPYYLSEFAEKKGGGTTRRTIANMAELIAALNARFEQTKVVSLERWGLAEQIALFQMADVVVAQHGAGLSNLVWMRPGTHLFEYVDKPAQNKHFCSLSPIFGISHHTLTQEDARGPVDVKALMDAIASHLSPRRFTSGSSTQIAPNEDYGQAE